MKKVLFIILYAQIAMTILASEVCAQTPASTTQAVMMSEHMTPERVAKRLDDILISEDYSNSKQESQWQRKEPVKNKEQKSSKLMQWLQKLFGDYGESVSAIIGLMGKTIALLFLVFLAWLIYRYRDMWLKWLSATAPHITQKPETQSHTVLLPSVQDIWQDLPPTSEFLPYLKRLLECGEWLMVVSVLYRGTLRELVYKYALPIQGAQTEEECQQLLQQNPHIGEHERDYFEQLMTMWQTSAYGHHIPAGVKTGDYADIYQLINGWAALYHRHGGR